MSRSTATASPPSARSRIAGARARCRGQGRDARVRRHPHAPRRADRLGSARLEQLLARRDERGARELRRDVRAVRAGRTRVPRRAHGVGGGHPPRLDPRRPRVGLDHLRRVPRRDRPAPEGHQLRRDGRPLRVAPPRDGRARPVGGARDRRRDPDRRRHRGDVRSRRRGDRRGCARVRHEPHPAAPGAGRTPGSRHVGRRARALRDRRRARPAPARRVRGCAAVRAARPELRERRRRDPLDGRGPPPHRTAGDVRHRPDRLRPRAAHRGLPVRRGRSGCGRRHPPADHAARHRAALRSPAAHVLRPRPRVGRAQGQGPRRAPRGARRRRDAGRADRVGAGEPGARLADRLRARHRACQLPLHAPRTRSPRTPSGGASTRSRRSSTSHARRVARRCSASRSSTSSTTRSSGCSGRTTARSGSATPARTSA